MKCLAFLVGMFLTATVDAQPAPVHKCANCHGSRGEGGLTGAPRLAGLARGYFLEQLAAFAEGRRLNGVMTPLARSLTPQERESLAAYYEGLRAPTLPPQVGLPREPQGGGVVRRGG